MKKTTTTAAKKTPRKRATISNGKTTVINDVDKHNAEQKALNEQIKPSVIPEGMTAAAVGLSNASKSQGLGELDKVKVQLLDRAFEFLGKDNVVIAEIADKGVEHFAACLVAIGEHDPQGALQVVKAVMRQLTKDVHFRFSAVQKEQMFASRANGGGVDGYELPVGEIMDRYANYDGSSDFICTPATQVEAVKDMQAMLNEMYVALERLRLHWMSKSEFAKQQPQLPFAWYVDKNSKYHECEDFESAIRHLDDKDAEKAEQRLANQKNALGALRNLKIA